MIQTQGSSTHWIEGNGIPCAEQPLGEVREMLNPPMDDAGGFLVPPELVEGLYKQLGWKSKKEKTMTLLTTGRYTVNLDQMADYEYVLKTITDELSLGDIFNVEVIITLVNGDYYVLDEMPDLVSFIKTIQPDYNKMGVCSDDKTLGYYLQKSRDYQQIKKENETK